MPAGGLPGLCLELAVKFGAVVHDPRQVAAASKLPDESSRMPRCAVGQLQALKQHHVAYAALGQMVGNAAADDAAADNRDAAFGGNLHEKYPGWW